jgi:hypothetical protein
MRSPSAPPAEREDANEHQRKKTGGDEQLKIISGVPAHLIGTIAEVVGKQVEIDRAAMTKPTEEAKHFSHAYHEIK